MVWWMYVAIFLGIIFVLLNISQTTNYYVKIVWFYVSILLHGIECMITMIPSYLRCSGADLIFHEFAYWCFWTGIKYEIRGYEEHLGHLDEPAVVICNHQSSIDIISMSNVWPSRGVVMMKRSLNFVPFFNFASWLAHSIYVDRFNKERAMATIDHTINQLKSKNHKLWVFPEGTRNYKGGLLPFKKGAFNIAVRAQIPIIPIVVSEYKPFYSKKDKYFRNDGFVIAEVLPPIKTEGMTPEDVDKLVDDTRETMLKVLNRISPEAKEIMEKKRKAKSN